jgi:hypothetical protein
MTDCKPLRILLPLLGLVTAILVAGCPDDSDDTRTPSRDAGAAQTKESCIAAGIAEGPIECPEGCSEIRAYTAESCVPDSGSGAPTEVVGCTNASLFTLLESCYRRPGSPEVYAVTLEGQPDLLEQGWEPCDEQGPACEL